MSETVITGWHFTADRLRNGSPIPPVGEWLQHNGSIVPCRRGLHCSEHPFDALQYAPGSILHRVELRGDVQSHGDPVDKYVGRERRILATVDAENLLRDFARWCALQVIDDWHAPRVVRRWLVHGGEFIRSAAYSAADSTACSAACSAAHSAAHWAADSAARSAADSAAREHFGGVVSQLAAEGKSDE